MKHFSEAYRIKFIVRVNSVRYFATPTLSKAFQEDKTINFLTALTPSDFSAQLHLTVIARLHPVPQNVAGVNEVAALFTPCV